MQYTIIQGYDGSVQKSFEWTTEPPTKEGWYWTQDGTDIRIVKVYQWQHRKFNVDVDGEILSTGMFVYWLGPLPLPDIPTK